MKFETILKLHLSSLELREEVASGEASKVREAEIGHPICRLSDEAMAEYAATADAIDKLTARFPDFMRVINRDLELLVKMLDHADEIMEAVNKSNAELAS